MSLRINMLSDSEYRYSGAVSHRFIAQIVLMVGVGVSLLIIAVALFHVSSIRQDLAWHRDQWTRLEPTYNKMNAMQAAATTNTKLLGELKGRTAWRLEWNSLLPEVQKVVPAYVQLSGLDIRSLADREADKSKSKIKAPSRRYEMQLSGKALGREADKVVFRFLEDLEAATAFQEILESVKLQGRMTSIKKGKQFGIQALTKSRKMAWTGKG